MTKRREFKLGIQTVSTILGVLGCAVFIIYGFQKGIFSSAEAFQAYLAGFGFWAPFIFMVIQVVQVIVPIIPGGVSCLVGVLAFGGFYGFIYNYVGLCVGSILAFMISRQLGYSQVEKMMGGSKFEKYFAWTRKGKAFERLFAAAIFFPMSPDDLLCYIAGLTNMSLKKFILIILLGKPLSILIYSMGLEKLFSFIF